MAIGFHASQDVAHVYVYYDGPKLYTCTDANGELCLVCWVDDDESTYSWLVVKLSHERQNRLDTGKITHREIYTKAESGSVELYLVGHNDEILRQTTIACGDIPDDLLPGEGTYLRSGVASGSSYTRGRELV